MLKSPLTLPRFETDEALSQWRSTIDDRKFFYRLFFMYFGVVTYSFFGILDVLVGEAVTSVLLYWRVLGVAGMVICTILYHLKSWRKRTGIAILSDLNLLTAFFFSPILTIIGMTIFAEGTPAATYPLGMAVCLMGAPVVSLPFKHTSVLAGCGALAYWATVPFSNIPPEGVAMMAFFLNTSMIMVTMAALVIEVQERMLEFSLTEITEARDTAIAAKQAQETFVASISHELRPPLSAIMSNSEMMLYEGLGELPVAYKDAARDTYINGDILYANFSDLMDHQRQQAGDMRWADDYFLIEDLLRTAVASCRTQATEAKMELIRIKPSDNFEIFADMARVMQTVTNLIRNALKYSQAGSRVTVGAELRDNGDCAISVIDNGCGISEDDLNRIREPFVQAGDRENDPRKSGLGLGLSIVTGIVARLDGQLEIESKLGEGTTASIVIPKDRVDNEALSGNTAEIISFQPNPTVPSA